MKKHRANIIGLCVVMLFIISSCSYDKILTGTYYVKHNNSVEEYLIVKPDSTYTQFLIKDNNIRRNDGIYIRYAIYGDSDYKFKNYINGFDPPHDKHISNKNAYELLATFTATIAGKGQIIIEYNMDIYATKINQSFNSDSILTVIKSNLE